MQERILSLLRCPVSRSPLRLSVTSTRVRSFDEGDEVVIHEGILFAAEDWFYPIIDGVPRLNVESFLEYSAFCSAILPDYERRHDTLMQKHAGLIHSVLRKNRRTKESFALEWSLYDYDRDRTWEAANDQLLPRFLEETGETAGDIGGKLILDAGCGNGQLDQYIAGAGALVIGLDFSNSVERACRRSRKRNAVYIMGDIEFPPVDFRRFDIVHCSGVLIHTENTQRSFDTMESCVKPGGRLSVWLYHPRRDRIHNFFNRIRQAMVPLPLKIKYYILVAIFLPVSFVVKRLKGNRQNKREMLIALLDGFTPEFRHEHSPAEAAGWFANHGYQQTTVTTVNTFGFCIAGINGTASRD